MNYQENYHFFQKDLKDKNTNEKSNIKEYTTTL